MKNSNLYKKYLSIFLTLLIIFFSFYHSYFTSYAVFTDEEKDLAKYIGKSVLEFLEDFGSTAFFVGSQVGAVVKNDYEEYLKNNENYKNYWKDKYITSSDNTNAENQENYITINKYTNEVTFSEDLIEYFKKSLKEYSEETNGYWLVPTMKMSYLNPAYFYNRSQYITIQNLINNYGIIGLHIYDNNNDDPEMIDGKMYNLYTSCYALDFSPYINSDYNIVSTSSSWDGTNTLLAYIYDSNWKINYIEGAKSIPYDVIYNSLDNINSNGSKFSQAIIRRKGMNEGYFFRSTNYTYTTIISKDGCRLRVFKSVNAMKGYDTGTRTVYFTEQFYNDDSKAITVAVNELEDFMDKKYNQYIDDLSGLIANSGGNLTEADLEKLTAQVLGKLDENNGLLQEGNQITSYWLERIYKELVAIDEMMADKLDSILEYLKNISNWTVADTVVDGIGVIGDAVDFIEDLFSDAEGVADTALGTLLNALDGGTSLLSKKFPFSVPWDLLFFITILASDPEVPHFEIPLDFDISALDINVHYDFVVDFTDFQFLSDISRTLLSMTYCVGLIKLTTGIVSIKKEE